MNKWFSLIIVSIFIILFLVNILSAAEYPKIPNLDGLKVAIVTKSVSTAMFAKTVIKKSRAIETSLKEADYILTIVRSTLFNPLNYSYDNFEEFKRDVEMCLNISDPRGHIYVFKLDSDLKLVEISHNSFDWDVTGY